jgi:hypothetical protein
MEGGDAGRREPSALRDELEDLLTARYGDRFEP